MVNYNTTDAFFYIPVPNIMKNYFLLSIGFNAIMAGFNPGITGNGVLIFHQVKSDEAWSGLDNRPDHAYTQR